MRTNITSRLRKINNCMYLVIPKEACRFFELDEGDKIVLQIQNIVKANEIVMLHGLHYRCRVCNNYFDTVEIEPYCTICGEDDNLEEITHD